MIALNVILIFTGALLALIYFRSARENYPRESSARKFTLLIAWIWVTCAALNLIAVISAIVRLAVGG